MKVTAQFLILSLLVCLLLAACTPTLPTTSSPTRSPLPTLGPSPTSLPPTSATSTTNSANPDAPAPDVVAPPAVVAEPGDVVTMTFTVTNTGSVPDTFHLTVLEPEYGSAILGWGDISAIPETISLQPGESVSYDVVVAVPEGYPVSARYNLVLDASSLNDDSYDSDHIVVLASPDAISCAYPIALQKDTITKSGFRQELVDITRGVAPGNFGWLSWTGDLSIPALTKSLTPPGDSDIYVNPHDPNDHTLSIGDWVRGMPNVSDSEDMHKALDDLKDITITVPVWDEVSGQGNELEYRVFYFGRIKFACYHLQGQNSISVVFYGRDVCGAP